MVILTVLAGLAVPASAEAPAGSKRDRSLPAGKISGRLQRIRPAVGTNPAPWAIPPAARRPAE